MMDYPQACDFDAGFRECRFERAQFNQLTSVYKTMNYNTFAKNGVLKLTEVEVSDAVKDSR